jgi:Uma2 family endonuclease
VIDEPAAGRTRCPRADRTADIDLHDLGQFADPVRARGMPVVGSPMSRYSSSVDAVWLDVPAHVLDERRRLGHDKKDELWEGVLHMVPPPSRTHVAVAFSLAKVLERIASRRDLVAYPEPIGVYAPDVDPPSWRIPDASIAARAQESDRGLEGAVLAVEVLSPHDESYDKFAFYARVGVEEVWIIDPPTRAAEIFTIHNGSFVAVSSCDGVLVSPRFGLALETIATPHGPRLRISDGADVAEI